MSISVLGANLGLAVYSITVLSFMIITICTHSMQFSGRSGQKHSFIALCTLIIFLIIMDLLGYLFDSAVTDIGRFIQHASNFLLFFFNQFMFLLWFYYISYVIQLKKQSLRRCLYFYYTMCLLCSALVIVNLFTGCLYYYDSSNIYHRGRLFVIPSLIMLIMTLHIEYITLKSRHLLEHRRFIAFECFMIIPTIGATLQIFTYGIAFGLNSAAFCMLITFIYGDTHSADFDELTGTFNRRRLDSFMQQKINISTSDRTFSAVMLDIYDLRKINETYGYETGSRVLRDTVTIIKSAVSRDTFIARFGGDEFFIIVDDDDYASINSIALHIRKCADDHFRRAGYPFEVAYSIGFASYHTATPMSVDQFENYVDKLMYADRQIRYCNPQYHTHYAPSV